MSDSVAVWIRRIRGTAIMRRAPDDLLELGIDDTGILKIASQDGELQAVDNVHTQTIAGAKTFSAATVFNGAVTLGDAAGDAITVTGTLNARQSFERVTASTEAVLAADSPKVYVDVQAADAATTFTLPLASTAGLTYTFIAGNVTGSTNELLLAVQTGDNIVGKIHASDNGTALATAANTGIKNTAATNVVGDTVTLVSDGVTTWFITAQTGVWASR